MPDAPALTILTWARSAARLNGAFAEAGVFRGGSARLFCEVKGQAPLHLFDVFETLQSGADESTEAAEAAEAAEAEVRDHFGAVYSGLEEVRRLLAPYPRVHFHPGWFPRSAQPVTDVEFAFVHLDLDLEQGTRDALEFFYPRLLPGGVMIGDDYNLPAVRAAFTEFFAGRCDAFAELPWNQVVVIKRG
jgi:hypothetical protein